MKKAEIILTYQNLISHPPVSPKELHQQACSNDGNTVDAWRQIWLDQIKANKKTYGSFSDHALGSIFGEFKYKTVIVAGSGPSLKENAEQLKYRGEIPLLSCLHNFQYFEDLGVMPNYYVSLDAGPVTVEEVYEGGTKSEEEYWAATEKHTLLCFIGSHPDLLKKWRGKILFFSCPMPDDALNEEIDQIEKFDQYVSTGGNVFGASLYIAKGFLGASGIAFVGADFCFSYMHKFHAWDSKYDKNLGHCVSLTDIYGNRRLTWQSYANFKCWFDSVPLRVPGLWINCSEGGCLGSYPQGNLDCFKYMDLKDFYKMMNLSEYINPNRDTSNLSEQEKKQKVILF